MDIEKKSAEIDSTHVPPPLKEETPTTSRLAIWSLVCGILTPFTCVTGPVALVFGYMALKRIRQSPDSLRGRRLAITGIGIGGVSLVVGSVLAATLPALARFRTELRRADCANNIYGIGMALKMYAEESPAKMYPELSAKAGNLMLVGEQLYPEYLEHTWDFFCPDDVRERGTAIDGVEAINDESLVYLGYAITSDDEMEAFAEVYAARVKAGLPFNEHLSAPPGKGSFGGDVFLRFGPKVDAILKSRPADAAKIAVMWDQFSISQDGGVGMFNHIPGGSNVLYLDGHVAFVRYPSEWPITKRTGVALTAMGALGEAP